MVYIWLISQLRKLIPIGMQPPSTVVLYIYNIYIYLYITGSMFNTKTGIWIFIVLSHFTKEFIFAVPWTMVDDCEILHQLIDGLFHCSSGFNRAGFRNHPQYGSKKGDDMTQILHETTVSRSWNHCKFRMFPGFPRSFSPHLILSHPKNLHLVLQPKNSLANSG